MSALIKVKPLIIFSLGLVILSACNRTEPAVVEPLSTQIVDAGEVVQRTPTIAPTSTTPPTPSATLTATKPPPPTLTPTPSLTPTPTMTPTEAPPKSVTISQSDSTGNRSDEVLNELNYSFTNSSDTFIVLCRDERFVGQGAVLRGGEEFVREVQIGGTVDVVACLGPSGTFKTTLTRPDGTIETGAVQIEPGSDDSLFSVPGQVIIPFKPEILLDPPGLYRFEWMNEGGSIVVDLTVTQPEGATLYRRSDASYVLYQFMPNESVVGYFYGPSDRATEALIAVVPMQVDGSGTLIVQPDLGAFANLYAVKGEQSGWATQGGVSVISTIGESTSGND